MKAPFFHSMLTFLLFQFVGLSTCPAGSYLGYSDYQIVTDTSFPAGRYFQAMSDSGVNFQRIWALGYSGVEKKFDERMPFVYRKGKYDLNQIDPAYMERLRRVLNLANRNGQKVMLTLFDNWSLGKVVPRTPWYYKNNVQRLKIVGRKDFYSVQNRKLLKVQEHYVRAIVVGTKDFSPIYEIVNEGSGVSCEQLAAWHEQIAAWIQNEAPDAEIGVNVGNTCAQILEAPWADVISLHHGNWSARSVCSFVEQFPQKEVIMDTDGAWKYRDDNRLVQKWLDEAMSCGASFNHKDDIYNPDWELLKIYKMASEHLP
jgi:hypothetical protein